jgi:pimeloyl-ACP methyl ester carboxylesterase
MKRKLLALVILQFAALSVHAAEAFTVRTSDGITVHGDIYMSEGASLSAPLILLFHQGGGDSRGEYGPLVPTLLDDGYNLVAIDQRSGGERFEGVNRTLAGIGDSSYGYCDALPDLEAALSFARERGFDGPTAVWGSSYSATLVFRLAVDHPDEIDAVLAFSPASGEPMAGCRPEPYSATITQPVLSLRPASEMEIASVAEQHALFEKHGHQTYVADPGVHGSSMLSEARVGAPVVETWKVVRTFLRNSLSGPD